MDSEEQPRHQAVAVITGAGGMGVAIARRISPGRLLLLADYSAEVLSKAKSQLEDEGYAIETHIVDVSDSASVSAFAAAAETAGRVEAVVHTAGVSPVMAPVRKVLEVDMLGTALVIEAFRSVLAQGGSMVCIASMAGYMLPTSFQTETGDTYTATAPASEVLDHLNITEIEEIGGGLAYCIAKRANHLRVQAAAPSYGKGGCRINSVSPGAVHTAMVRQELACAGGKHIEHLVDTSAMARYGTPADIANVVAFLLSPESSFITGADFLVDGGSVASQRWGGDESAYDSASYDQA